jgi:hypothetical protein
MFLSVAMAILFLRGILYFPWSVFHYHCHCRPRDARRAKYELMHSVRSHLGCEDDAFGCMGNGEDAEGVKGVFLRRNVVNVAGRALKYNLTRLGPLVLPYSQLVWPWILTMFFKDS